MHGSTLSMTGYKPEDLHFGKTSKSVAGLARFGYATKGLVYVLIGGLAVMAAVGAGGSTEGSKGAISYIGEQPFGQVLLALVAIGMFGYAVWRFVEAVQDPDNRGNDAKGLAMRTGFAVSGLIHAALAWWAASIVFGNGGGGGGSGEQSKEDWTAWLMSFPFGVWLVAIVGLIIAGVGVAQFVKAYKADFMRHYNLFEMEPKTAQWSKRLGQAGLAARGVVFLIIGGFLVLAGWQSDPSEATGLSGALDALARQPFGPWLMGIVAAGLVAYGLHCFLQARYRHFEVQG